MAVGEGLMAPTPPPRGRVDTTIMLSQENFDASVHMMYRAQTMVIDTLKDLTLHGLENPPTFHLPSIVKFSSGVAWPRTNSEGEVEQLRMLEMRQKKIIKFS